MFNQDDFQYILLDYLDQYLSINDIHQFIFYLSYLQLIMNHEEIIFEQYVKLFLYLQILMYYNGY